MGEKANLYLDGIMGLVIGDALGNPVQFSPRDTIRRQGPVKSMESGGVFNTPAGTWTDDSSLALATLASIGSTGRLDYNDIMKRFAAWLYKGEYTPFGRAFDQGGTCTGAIVDYAMHHNPYACGRTGEYANGNGGLMRILPVCLYSLDLVDDNAAIRFVHDATALTHNHPRALVGSGIYYFMVKSIVHGVGDLKNRLQAGMDAAYKYYHLDAEYSEDLDHYRRLYFMSYFAETPESEIRSSGYVVDTLEAAVWSLLTTDSFEQALLRAVNLGDDADTVGAVAGGLAGLYYEYGAIPKEWLAVIQRREWIEGLCEDMRTAFDLPFC